MRQIAVLDWMAFFFKLFDRGRHVNGIPQNHRVRDQI